MKNKKKSDVSSETLEPAEESPRANTKTKKHRITKKDTKTPANGEKKEEVPEETLADCEDRLLRLRADFDNFRKRTMREKSEVTWRAREEIMVELLTVLDHLDLGLNAVVEHEANEVFVEGYKMVAAELIGVLHKFGVEIIKTKGKEFDPKIHEAVSQTDSDDHSEGAIVSEVRKGYFLDGKLLRTAQVVVAASASGTDGGNEE